MEMMLGFLDPEENLHLIINKECFLDIKGG